MTITISIVGCSQKNETEPQLAGDCIVSSFFEGISRDLNDNNYIIKGIVLDKVEYGLNISLVEDLKGNFPKKVNTFIIWGADDAFDYVNIELNRMDNLTLYKKNDVLIMHLIPTRRDMSGWTPLEKPKDYTTIGCAYSVLKLSDGYVTGHILSSEDKENRWWENMTQEELTLYIESLPLEERQSVFMDTMPFDDFQKKTNEFLTNK